MLDQKQKKYSNTGSAARFFESDAMLDMYTKRYPTQIRLPAHDDVKYHNIIPHTRTLWTAIIELDPTTNVLFNLNDLADYGFSPEVLRYIKEEGYKWITKPYACMLNISLYRNENLTKPANLMVDKDLNVIALDGTDIRKINRVRISYYDNIKEIMTEAVVRLNAYPEALLSLVKAGNTNATDIRRLTPRVRLQWLIPHLEMKHSRSQEFFDMNAVLDRVTVQTSHVRAIPNKGMK